MTGREVLRTCLNYIKTKWFDEEGMIIAVDGEDFLADVHSAMEEVIGIGERSSSKT